MPLTVTQSVFMWETNEYCNKISQKLNERKPEVMHLTEYNELGENDFMGTSILLLKSALVDYHNKPNFYTELYQDLHINIPYFK